MGREFLAQRPLLAAGPLIAGWSVEQVVGVAEEEAGRLLPLKPEVAQESDEEEAGYSSGLGSWGTLPAEM